MVLSCPVFFVLWKTDYLLEIDLFKADFQLFEHSAIRTKFLSPVEVRVTGSLLYVGQNVCLTSFQSVKIIELIQ